MKRRLLSVVMAMALTASLLAVLTPQSQALVLGTGTAGSVTWTVDIPAGESLGTLTIRRTGASGNAVIQGYSAANRPPWFAHSAQVNQIIIEANVTTIGSYAFAEFGNLTEVVIRGSITQIGNDAFRGCSNLVNFRNTQGGAVHSFGSLTTIGASAFHGCNYLESLHAPYVTSIGADAFVGCRRMNSINVGNSATSGRIRTLFTHGGANYNGVLVEMNTASTPAPYRIIKAPVNLAGNTPNSNEYSIPPGVTTIDSEAFAYCGNIARFIITANVNTIKDRAFAYNSGLMSATFLGDAPTSFGSNVFYGAYENYFKVIFYPQAQRWTTPRWQGYNSEVNNSRLELDKYVIVLERGEKIELRATAFPATASQSVTWTSANTLVAIVNESSTMKNVGIVEAGLENGTTTITAHATDSDAVAHCTVIVIDYVASASVVLFEESRKTVSMDDFSTQLTAIVYPYPDGVNTPHQHEIARNLVWTSSNSNVAVVSAEDPDSLTRKIILRGPGTTTITVRTPDGKSSATCVLTVTAEETFVPVNDISLSITRVAMGVEIDLNEASTVRPSNATNKNILWAIIEDESTIKDVPVPAGGILAVPRGNTGTITLEATIINGLADRRWNYSGDLAYTKRFVINVVQFIAVTSITDVPSIAFAGVPLQLRGTVQPIGASYRDIEWSIGGANTAGAVINETNWVLTAQNPGTVSVTATIYNGVVSDTTSPPNTYTQSFIIRVDPYITHTLELHANPGGSVSGAPTRNYAAGEVVTITAIPNAGYTFSGWELRGDGEIADISSATTQFTMPASAVTVSAYFSYVGTSASGGSGGGGGATSASHYFLNSSVYTRNSSAVFGHVTVRDFQLFSSVTMDGRALTRNSHYTANRVGSNTEIILANGYLDTLSRGTHTLGVNFSDYVSVTAVFTVTWAEQTPQTYDDVRTSDWFFNSVAYVSERGWMTASSSAPRRFRPNENVTQGEVIDALYRMAGSPTVLDQNGQALQNRSAAFEWVKSNGILPLSGVYNLNNSIRRQDVAVVVARMVNVMRMRYPVVRSAPSFTDERQIDPNARSAINNLYMAGIMSGRTASTFVPLDAVTRAEYAAMLHRFAEAM